MQAQGALPVTTAERNVKASSAWRDYLKEMVEARTKANLAKVEMRYAEMRFFEKQGKDASARAEIKLSR